MSRIFITNSCSTKWNAIFRMCECTRNGASCVISGVLSKENWSLQVCKYLYYGCIVAYNLCNYSYGIMPYSVLSNQSQDWNGWGIKMALWSLAGSSVVKRSQTASFLYLVVRFPNQHTATTNGCLVSGPSDFQIISSRLVICKHQV